MMPTWARPATIVFSPAPCPCTSADGLSTRRYSAGRLNCLPSSNLISSRFSAFFRRSSTGQGGAAFKAGGSPPADRRPAVHGDFVIPQGGGPSEHDGQEAATERVGRPRPL